MKSCSETLSTDAETSDDMIWEYDGLHEAYQGECEEILLEMQKIFYEDLENEQIGKGKFALLYGYDSLYNFRRESECFVQLTSLSLKLYLLNAEPDSYINTWEDEEDEYLARAVFENMQLNDDKV